MLMFFTFVSPQESNKTSTEPDTSMLKSWRMTPCKRCSFWMLNFIYWNGCNSTLQQHINNKQQTTNNITAAKVLAFYKSPFFGCGTCRWWLEVIITARHLESKSNAVTLDRLHQHMAIIMRIPSFNRKIPPFNRVVIGKSPVSIGNIYIIHGGFFQLSC